MTILIISLPTVGADTSASYDHVLSGDGQTVSAHGNVPLALLPQGADEVVALVPAQAISWHQVKLPEGSIPRGFGGDRSGVRLRSILEGLLEDQLLDEPGAMHLALQAQAASGAAVWVAACDRTWLKNALGVLAQAGFAVKRIVPEFSPDMLQGKVVVTGDTAHPLVAAMQQGGSSAQSDQFETTGLLVTDLSTSALQWLQMKPAPLSAISTGPNARNDVQVLAEPAVAAVAENLFNRPVALMQHAERLVQAAGASWDLAQFDLAHADRQRRVARISKAAGQFGRAPQWRAARWALLTALLVNVIGLNAFAWREQSALDAKRQAVRSVLTDTFPKVPVVVDAPVQMAREVAVLKRSNGASGGGDLESILASFSAVAPVGYAVTAIEFAAGEVRLKGPPLPEPDNLVERLGAQGLRASPQGEQWMISPGAEP